MPNLHTRLHTTCGRICRKVRVGVAYGQADNRSIKKPIQLFLARSTQTRLESIFKVAELITYCSRLFQRLSTKFRKEMTPQTQSIQQLFSIFAQCPLVRMSVLSVNMLPKDVTDHALYILKTSGISARFLLSSTVHSPNNLSLSSYGNCLGLGTILVNLCCILSSNF